MTTKDKVARRKLSMLELASEISNVSKACRIMGYSRQQFYEIRRNFQTYGAEGLMPSIDGRCIPTPQAIADNVDNSADDTAVIDTRLAVGSRKVGSDTFKLSFGKPVLIGHGNSSCPHMNHRLRS